MFLTSCHLLALFLGGPQTAQVPPMNADVAVSHRARIEALRAKAKEQIEQERAIYSYGELAGFDTGTEPWQSASALVKLRNALIHYEPEWVQMPGGDQTHRFEKSLRGKFADNPLAPADSAYYPAKLLGYGCAQWAVKTALRFSSEFAERLGLFGSWLGAADSPELSTE